VQFSDRDDAKRKKRKAPAGVSTRDARLGDEADLRLLWRELMDLHAALDARFKLADNADEAFLSYVGMAMRRDDYRVRVATIDERLVGFAVCCVLPNSPVYKARWIGYINDLSVTATMRGRGIGELLVNDCVKWLKDAGADSIEVYVAHKNDGAQRFWRRVGGRDYLDRMSLDTPE
jgi:ribosomal protein S18 acetylase RimI-like enzyme